MSFTLTRSLLVVVLPGLVAIAPWALWWASRFEKVDHLYATYSILAHALLVGAAVVVGSVSETALTHLEVRWDNEREKELNVHENWYSYLTLTPDNEPVGFRYISSKATTMYFELAMMVATPISLAGVAVLTFSYSERWRLTSSLAIAGLALASICFFRSSAKRTHLVLCQARKELVTRL